MPTAVEHTTASGLEARTYYNTGTRASRVVVEIARISGEKFDPGETAKIEDKSRASVRSKSLSGHDAPAKLSFTYSQLKGTTDSVFDALLAMKLARTTKEFLVMDDAYTSTGAEGFAFFGKLFKFEQSRENDKTIEWSAEIEETTHYESGAICELQQVVISGGT